jgi:putative SOS response-associated peptidase YedK
MCYSAQVLADYRKFVRQFGAVMDLREFWNTVWTRSNRPGSRVKIPKSMEAAFADPHSEQEREIKAELDAFASREATRIEQELFAQRTRLVEAERKLAAKPTKAAAESQRIATAKIETARGWLADLRRTVLEDRDSRIFPGMWAPVIVFEEGRRVVKPMRYQCRPAGKPAFHDAKFPGTYNARRDNLEGFWQGQFGRTHALMPINAFYENVKRHATEGRALAPGEAEENLVLEFRPRPTQDMLVACLWSRWRSPSGDEELLSFAAITDEPPPEIAAAGHDRCIIPIKPEHIDAWLQPNPRDLRALYAILDDRERPYYEHRLAA